MSERHYAMYLKTFAGESMEDRVRGHYQRRFGEPRPLFQVVRGACWYDDNIPVSIVTVVE